MIEPLMLAGVIGLIAATTALWAQRRAMIHQRIFAGLVSLAVTVILFSLIAWAATIAPLLLVWIFVGAFALMFALRLYRELRTLPEVD